MNPALQPAWEGAVAEYDFALFLLPDPDATAPAPLTPGHWTNELIKYGDTNATTVNPPMVLPTTLDSSIGCWKIVYVVLSVRTNADIINGTSTYCHLARRRLRRRLPDQARDQRCAGANATDLSLGGKPLPAPHADKISARRPSIGRTFNSSLPRHARSSPQAVDDVRLPTPRRNFGVIISSEVLSYAATPNISVSYAMASGLLSSW